MADRFREPDATDRRANGKASTDFDKFSEGSVIKVPNLDKMRLRPLNSGPIALLTPRLVYIHRGRHFLTAFNSDPINISIQRNLPYSPLPFPSADERYPAPSLYPLIADVDSYSQFLPFCMGSTVTRRDAANSPTHADLEVGFDSWSETFSSRVSCVQNEAVTVCLVQWIKLMVGGGF
jgi:hypothetical protein